METRVDLTPLVKKDKEPIEPKVEIFCLDITHLSRTNQFVICTFCVFVLFVAYGFLQELLFTLDGFKPYGWYLTLVQFAFYSVFGYVECYVAGMQRRKIPLKIYGLLAFLTLGTMGFSNSSLAFLNYPTQVIFKCCKLIPVMIGSVLIQKKKYKPIDVAAALAMCVGLAWFTLADSQVSPNFSFVGVCMISCALLCDAVIGNVQEKYMKLFGASNREVVLYSYAIGFCYLLVVMMTTGHLSQGFWYFMQVPKAYGYAFLFSLSGYMGIQIVLTLVISCGALAAVTVTTCRKAVTIVFSFLFFTKPFTFQYLWGGLLIILGIYLNVLSKNKQSFNFELPRLINWPRSRRSQHKSVETTV